MTPLEIAKAWWSVQDRWFTRRNKMHDSKQYEVVHDWGRDLISENTMKVLSRHETQELAEKRAKILEDAARGAAVLAALSNERRRSRS
jgi:hypothetical protein